MSFEMAFLEEALVEWRELDGTFRTQLRKKLTERLQTPHVPAVKLSGHPDRYKIKLLSVGHRLQQTLVLPTLQP